MQGRGSGAGLASPENDIQNDYQGCRPKRQGLGISIEVSRRPRGRRRVPVNQTLELLKRARAFEEAYEQRHHKVGGKAIKAAVEVHVQVASIAQVTEAKQHIVSYGAKNS